MKHRLAVSMLVMLFFAGGAQAAFGATQVPDPDHRPVVEWFHGPGAEDALDVLEEAAADGRIVLLHWRLAAEDEGSNFPDDDATLRAEAWGITEGPALVVDGTRHDDLRPTSIENLISQAPVRDVVLQADLTVEVFEEEEGHTVVVQGSIVPVSNLSSGTMVLLTLTDLHAVDHHGREAVALVRDMRPEAAFNRTEGSTTDVVWRLAPEHLLAAGVDLEESDLGYRLHLLVVDGTEVLEVRSMPLPSSVVGADAKSGLSLLPLLCVVVVVLGLLLRSEIVTAAALPRVVAAPWLGTGSVTVHVAAGSEDCALTRIEAEPPWSLRWSKRLQVPAGTVRSVDLRPTRGGEAPLHLELALEVEGHGGWIQSLNVERP